MHQHPIATHEEGVIGGDSEGVDLGIAHVPTHPQDHDLSPSHGAEVVARLELARLQPASASQPTAPIHPEGMAGRHPQCAPIGEVERDERLDPIVDHGLNPLRLDLAAGRILREDHITHPQPVDGRAAGGGLHRRPRREAATA